jgi:hypothetical protein
VLVKVVSRNAILLLLSIGFFIARYRRSLGNTLHLLSSVMSVLAFSYLVIDLRFQSAPSISSAASDPLDPFRFPFSFTNNSHLFSVYNVSWTCHLERLVSSGGFSLRDAKSARMMVGSGSASTLEPGEILNLDCSRSFPAQVGHIEELSMSIDTTYTMYTLGFLPSVARQSTFFRWYPDASNPQWVKGKDAH